MATIENANKQRASAAQVVDGRQEKVWSRIQVEFQKKKKKSCQLIQKKSKNDTVKRFDHRTLQSPHYNTLVVVHSGRHPKTCMCVSSVSVTSPEKSFSFPTSPRRFREIGEKSEIFLFKILQTHFDFYYSGDALKSPKISIFIDCVRESDEKFQILSISAALYERETELDLFSFLLQKGT